MTHGPTIDSHFYPGRRCVSDLAIGDHIRVFAGKSPDCDCREEEWICADANLLIHIEPDNSIEAVLCFFEDFDLCQTFPPNTAFEDARARAFAWAVECTDGNITGERV